MNETKTNVKKEELEIMRHNVTPSQFLAYVRKAIRSHKLTAIDPMDIDLNYWKRGNDLNFDHKYTDPENDPVEHEKSVSRPYEMQTYIRNWDGTVYNLIIEFQFDDDKHGFGYFYLINTWTEEEKTEAIPEAPEAIPETKEERKEGKPMKKTYKMHKAKQHKKQYSPENVRLLAEAIRAARELRRTGEEKPVSISEGNVKMGKIKSVSVMPFLTCAACTRETCGPDCYAARMVLYGLHAGTTRQAWAKNTVLAIDNPGAYWAQVRKASGKESYFRFHVGGDIINDSYFAEMIATAKTNPGTHYLAFTKKYEIVNRYCDANGGRDAIPENMQIIFSCWTGITVPNPYKFPETDVIMPDVKPSPDMVICGGNCETCIASGAGCWNLKANEKLWFYLH